MIMALKRLSRVVVCASGLLIASATSSLAQVTTGTVLGTVVDQQGGAISGATVVLTSDTQATKSAPVVTNSTGDFLFPNVRPDTYTIEISMPAFKTMKRTGVIVSPGSRAALGSLTWKSGFPEADASTLLK